MQQISMEIIGTSHRSAAPRRIDSLVGGFRHDFAGYSRRLCDGEHAHAMRKFQVAAQQFSAMQTDVEALRNVNQSLKTEVERLRNDPRAIESAARARLNMVRSNEYVVPVD